MITGKVTTVLLESGTDFIFILIFLVHGLAQLKNQRFSLCPLLQEPYLLPCLHNSVKPLYVEKKNQSLKKNPAQPLVRATFPWRT